MIGIIDYGMGNLGSVANALAFLQAPARLSQIFAVLLLALLSGLAWQLYGEDSASQTLGLSLAGGSLFGVLLQRSRFCSFCLTRDFVERRDPRGALGILAALAVGLTGYHLLFGAFTPDPFAGRLPPDAHIGPVSWVLVVAAALFAVMTTSSPTNAYTLSCP